MPGTSANNTPHERASEILLGHWRNQTRCAEIPQQLRPQGKKEAYALQALIERESASPLYGWKIAATSLAGQNHIGVSGPLAGRYIAERVVPSGGTIRFGANHMKVAEIEFAFRLAADIAPRNAPYTEQDVMASVATMHPAIEVPDSRFDRFETVGEAQLIADNACADWLAVGDAFPDSWRTLDLAAFEPVGQVAGKGEVKGRGSNVLGSPVTALTWLVNELASLGVTVRAGQTVTTGTCVVPMPIASGAEVTGNFPGLGSISVRIGA